MEHSACTITEVSEKCGLAPLEITELAERYGIELPRPNGEPSFDMRSQVLFCRLAKLLRQTAGGDPEVKIRSLLRSWRNGATIGDVAIAADVSIGAVSSTLNNSQSRIKVSGATRDRIYRAAMELDYQPNRFAAALRTKRTGIIGAIVRNIDDPFLRQLLRQVQVICEKNSYTLLMSHANREVRIAQTQLGLMLNQFFDGLLVLGDMTDDSAFLSILSRCGTPAVLVGGRKTEGVSTLLYDDIYGARLVFDHITGLGHKKLGFIGNLQHYSVQRRLGSLLDAQSELGEDCFSTRIVRNAQTPADAESCTAEMLSREDPPTAIVCGSDYLAQGVMTGVLKCGLRIPDDVSVIGYDDLDDGVFPVPITTVHQPVERAAAFAVEQLLIQMSAEAGSRKTAEEVIYPSLVIRSSCKALSGD